MVSRRQRTAGSIPGMSVGVHTNMSKFSERNFLNWAFSSTWSFATIRKDSSKWWESAWNYSAFSSDSMSKVSDSVKDSRSSLSPLCDRYRVATCFCFFPTGRSSSRAGFSVFGLQPNFFQAVTEMVLDMAWSPLMLGLITRVGYCTTGDRWMGQHSSCGATASQGTHCKKTPRQPRKTLWWCCKDQREL